MTDDSDADRQSADAAADSQLDDVLDRLESSLSEHDEHPERAERAEPTDNSASSEPSAGSPTESSETDDGDSTTKPSADPHSDSRLWDRFGADRQPDEPPDQPEPNPFEFDTVDDTPDHSNEDQSVADQVETATDRTSFRGILDRISHRIDSARGLVGSSASDPSAAPEQSSPQHSDSERLSVAAGDQMRSTQQDTTDSSADQYASTRPQADEPFSGGRAESQSVRIDQVLDTINLFGRATASSQVLLLSPTAHTVTNDIYRRVLLPTDGTGQNVLFVSAIQSASEQLSTIRQIPEWTHGNTAVIEIGQSALQPSTPAQGPDLTAQLGVYKQISNFQNLAKLGVNISHICSQWNATQRPSVVGVHTLSSIQQYVGNETMFQFLFTLKGQLNSMGVKGFYHMDPAAHSNNEISTITSAFDIVVTVSSDGSIDIQ